MIINKTTKAVQVRSDKPSTNWIGNDYYLIDETTDAGKVLVEKVLSFAPNFDIVLENDEIVDIVQTQNKQNDVPEDPLSTAQKQVTTLGQQVATLTAQNAVLGKQVAALTAAGKAGD